MGAKRQRAIQAKANAAAQRQIEQYKQSQAEAQAKVDEQRQIYRDFQFQNPYAGLENVFEDLTVDQRAAQFQAEQGQQQRANILAGLRGAAGTSGIAGLAQALAQQGTLESRQISTNIAQQERQNQQLASQAEMQLQQMEAGGAATISGAEFGREGTLLGMDYGELAGQRAGLQQSYANEMAAWGLASQMQSARMGMYGDIASATIGAISERRLKRNITLVGKSPSGLNIYNFEYINPKHGEGIYQGVMSDEVPKEAVLNHPDGYEMVDYSLIDVNFKKMK